MVAVLPASPQVHLASDFVSHIPVSVLPNVWIPDFIRMHSKIIPESGISFKKLINICIFFFFSFLKKR